jgi:ACS family glucarate transporter-like MFS transporter
MAASWRPFAKASQYDTLSLEAKSGIHPKRGPDGDISVDGSLRAGYRWLVLSFAWALFALSYVDRLAWANVSSPAGHSLGISVSALGVFATAFGVGYLFGNAIAGVTADRIGPRRILMASIVPLGVFTALFSSTTNIVSGLAFQAMMGLCAGTIFICGVKLITSWFPPVGRTTAMGIFMTGTSCGVVATNYIVPFTLQLVGWRGVYEILGGITVALGLAVYFVVRDGPKPTRAPKTTSLALRELFKNKNLWWLTLAGIGGPWGTWGFVLWANILLVSRFHLTPIDAGKVVGSFGVGAIIAKPLIGMISDALGGVRKPLAIAALLLFGISLITFGHLSKVDDFYWFAPILGVLAFVYSPLLNTMIAEVGGAGLSGSATGFTQIINTAVSAVQPIAVGFVYFETNSFFWAFGTLAIGPLLGAMALMAVQEPEQIRA